MSFFYVRMFTLNTFVAFLSKKNMIYYKHCSLYLDGLNIVTLFHLGYKYRKERLFDIFQVAKKAMYKIAICDDDKISLTYIHEVVSDYFKDKSNLSPEITTFSNASMLLASRESFDIYFLDIIMPDIDGIEIAKQLRRIGNSGIIIYLTSSKEFALNAFQVEAFQYLLKPVSKETLHNVLEKALHMVDSNHFNIHPKKLAIPTKNGIFTIAFDNLMYIEHLNRELYFHLKNGEVLNSSSHLLTLNSVATKLLPYQEFISPHRAYILNLKYVASVTKTDFVMQNGVKIPIPVRRHKYYKELFMDYYFRKNDI